MRAARAPRQPRDPDRERERIEARTLEVWIDEGDDLREEAEHAAARAAHASRRRRERPLDADVAAAIVAVAADRAVADRAIKRLADARAALDRDHVDEARRIVTPLLRTVPGVAAVHEVAGLVAYRRGRWREAVRELETARALTPNVDVLPVLADSYRALRRWNDVERVWLEVREASPNQDVMAEARIVAAGAQADRGDLAGALRTMDGWAPTPSGSATITCASGTCSATSTTAPATRSMPPGGSAWSPPTTPSSSTSRRGCGHSAGSRDLDR